MALSQKTRDFLSFLRQNRSIRDRIAAPAGKTLVYAGAFFKPVWRELADLKRTDPRFATKEILPDVLARIAVPGKGSRTLLQMAKDLDQEVPWKDNGFVAWRALSGIFAANAVGAVSFYVGLGITKEDKVFAATEIPVLQRNPNVDALTKDVLAYYQRCLQSKQQSINFGFISG